MKVLFIPEVVEQFLDLTNALIDKGYVNFYDEAVEYSQSLFLEVHNTLPVCVHRTAPPYFEKYGKDLLYASFKKSKHTTWYVFFNIYVKDNELIYLVRYISNNHVIAQYLYEG
ncbi:MAG: hypothetical protein IK042_05790 [Bacteroidales bacterium]|nr:hypothetical protein [Bacteroidales bacterium]